MTSDINSTLRETGDGLGFLLDQIQNPLVVLIIGLGVAAGIVSLFKGITTRIKDAM